MDFELSRRIIHQFSGLEVLVVGDLMLDAYIWGKVSRISPEAPIPIVEVTREEVRPGGAANVGLNLLALGAKVHFAGLVGDDEKGRELIEKIQSCGGQTRAIVVDPERPTTVKTRVLAHQQQMVRIDREKTQVPTGKTLGLLLEQINHCLPFVSGVILSDYDKGVLGADLAQALIVGSKGKWVAVDPKPQNIGHFAGASIITPNKREAELASGFVLRTQSDVEKAAFHLRNKYQLGSVLITRGEEGMSLLHGNHMLHLPTQARQVFDVTGAGDTVISVLALALCAGAKPGEAAELANLAAGITVAHLGVYAVKPAELLAAAETSQY